MEVSKVKLKYAINENGDLVHVDSVLKGLACNCYCPNCHDELVAKNEGKHNAHCFSHKKGADCIGAVESVLHKMAKDVLEREKRIMLPSMPNKVNFILDFDNVKTETQDKEINLRPDCVGYYGNKYLWIEFYRTHEVDAKKKGKIISAKIECIEIDINKCEQDPEKMRDFLINQKDNRRWIYNDQFNYSDDTRKRTDRNSIPHDYDLEYKQDHVIKRFFALEGIGEKRKLVNIHQDVIDMNVHRYYCPSCKKEVTIDMHTCGQFSFSHIDKDETCTDVLYLYDTAREAIRHKFYNSNKFEITLKQKCICKFKNECNLYNDDACYANFPFTNDLKTLKYNRCELNYQHKLSGVNSYIGLLREGDNEDDTIYISLKAPECDFPTEEIKERHLIIDVRSQLSILNILEYPVTGEIQNFQVKIGRRSFEELERKTKIGILYKDGSYELKSNVKCSFRPETKENVALALIMDTGRDEFDSQFLFVWYCIKNHYKINKCLLCRHLYNDYRWKYKCVYLNKRINYTSSWLTCNNASIQKETSSALEEVIGTIKIQDLTKISVLADR